jgi:uncharacterized protein (DUF1330 family)
MTYAIVRLSIKDFEEWKKTFDEAAPLRKSFGSKGVRVFRSSEKPTELVILGEYESAEKARALFQSAQFREAIQKAGVTAQPEVTLADQVHQLPS